MAVGSTELEDTKFMKGWSSEVFVDDANSALDLARSGLGQKSSYSWPDSPAV